MNYNFIGKFETLHSDLEFLLKSIYNGTELHLLFKESPKDTNTNVIKDFYKNISEENIEILTQIYHYDFLLFNYSSSLPQ